MKYRFTAGNFKAAHTYSRKSQQKLARRPQSAARLCKRTSVKSEFNQQTRLQSRSLRVIWGWATLTGILHGDHCIGHDPVDEDALQEQQRFVRMSINSQCTWVLLVMPSEMLYLEQPGSEIHWTWQGRRVEQTADWTKNNTFHLHMGCT